MKGPLDERDGQAVALALAELARARPGWLDYLGRVASVLGIRGHFEQFRAIRSGEPAPGLPSEALFAYLAGHAMGTYSRALAELRRHDYDAASRTLDARP